jgi:hypothetical protein
VPSSTPTATWTPTLPACPPVKMSVAYPNPVFSALMPVKVDLVSPCARGCTWRIISVANRVMKEGVVTVQGAKSVAWDQRDAQGVLASNGTYYFELAQDGMRVQQCPVVILR